MNSAGAVLVGADTVNSGAAFAGAVYYYCDPANSSSSSQLTATTPTVNAYFGTSVSLFENSALVGAVGESSYKGAVYYYSDITSGTPTPVALTTNTALSTYTEFGISVSLWGTSALVGAEGSGKNAVFYYSNLASSTEGIKITAPTTGDGQLGRSVSLFGTSALIADNYANNYHGRVYYFSDIATGGASPAYIALNPTLSYSENVFGTSVSLSGTKALIGAPGESNGAGGIYYYGDLTGGTPASVRLASPSPSQDNWFGNSVALSGTKAFVGEPNWGTGYGSSAPERGAVYYYSDLDAVTSVSKPSITFNASDASAHDFFGFSVSFSGDKFAIGASGTSKAYSGDIRAFTTNDSGVELSTGGLSFTTTEDWIIGADGTGSTVTLDGTDTAVVTTGVAAVFVGKEASANGNAFVVAGKLTVDTITIGADGNADNELKLESSAVVGAVDIVLYVGNFLRIADSFFGKNAEEVVIADVLGLGVVKSLSLGEDPVSALNAEELGLTVTAESGYIVVTANVPEPATYALIGAVGAVGLAFIRRRKSRNKK